MIFMPSKSGVGNIKKCRGDIIERETNLEDKCFKYTFRLKEVSWGGGSLESW
jgi:hypothetical protein